MKFKFLAESGLIINLYDFFFGLLFNKIVLLSWYK